MTEIHPTAVVDKSATVGADVRIGAFCVVGPETTLADGVELGHHVITEGRVVLEARVKIGHGTAIGGLPQDLKFKPGTPSGVRVGEATVVREYVTVHRSTHPEGWTEIGRDALVMAMSHVAHDCRLGNGVIVINYAGITGHCEVGDRATIGGHTGMVPFTRIGAYAYVGGCSKVHQDVPPFVIVDGNPAVARTVNVIGMRRGGIDGPSRRAVQSAFRVLYRSGLAPATAVARLKAELADQPVVAQMIAFIETSRLGIVARTKKRASGAGTGAEMEERIL